MNFTFGILLLFFVPSLLYSQATRVIYEQRVNRPISPIIDKGSELDPRKHYRFQNIVRDITSYPVFETNISLNSGSFAYQAFLNSGEKLEYSIRGEKFRFSECLGEICVLLTDRNMLAVSNYASEWAKNNFFSEMNFKTMLGEKALFVATETNVYYYNGYTNLWDRIPLNGEVVRGLSVKNDLGAIVTNKRIFGLDFENNKMNEMDVRHRGIGRLELKVDSIHFFSGDRVFQYSKHSNNFEIVRLDD